LNVNVGGNWKTQAEDPWVLVRALGDEIVKKRAGEGDRDAQWSLGYRLMSEADGGAAGTPLGTGGRSPTTDVGLTHFTALFPNAHKTKMRRVPRGTFS